MADEPAAGQADGAPSTQNTTDGAGGAGPGKGSQQADQSFLHTWQSKDDAEKGVKDLLSQVGKSNTERQRAQERMQTLEAEVQKLRDDRLDKLTDYVAATAGSGNGNSAADAERQFLEQLAERFDSEGGKALTELLPEYGQRVADDAYNRALAEFKKQNELTNKELAELKSVLKARDPEWVANQDRVAKLADELGVDAGAMSDEQRTLLIQVAKREKAREKAAHPDRPQIAGTTDTDYAGGSTTPPKLDEAIVANLKARGATDEDIAAVAKRMADKRAKRRAA